MRTKIFLLLAVFGLAFVLRTGADAQTATFSFNDGNGTPNAGSYAPGSSFTFSISLAFTPGGSVANLAGLSYWFEQQNPNAPYYFSITNRDVTGSQFTFLQTPALTYPQNLAPANANDLGASTQSGTGLGAGNYFIANITVSIDPAATLGSYVIESTTVVPKRSRITDDQGNPFSIPQAQYTITVVPEPATLSLLALGGIGAATLAFRRRRR